MKLSKNWMRIFIVIKGTSAGVVTALLICGLLAMSDAPDWVFVPAGFLAAAIVCRVWVALARPWEAWDEYL